jgi:hypothetical protein
MSIRAATRADLEILLECRMGMLAEIFPTDGAAPPEREAYRRCDPASLQEGV